MKNVKMNITMQGALRDAIAEVLKDTNVNIYEKFMTGKSDNTVEFEVNWKAIGSVDTETARQMARDIEKAARIVDFLNVAKIEFTFEEDAHVKELLEKGDVKEARQYINNYKEAFKTTVSSQMGYIFDMMREA